MEDSQANRLIQAQRYAQLYDFKQMITELAFANLPTDQRAALDQKVSRLDTDKLRRIFADAMAQVFTADELAACADFYGTPLGRSIMSKLPKFALAVTPGMNEEAQRALGTP